MTIFFEIAVALVLAATCGIIFHYLKQPAIIGFIIAGLIIGYFGGIRHAEHLDLVEALSSIGVALLLFIVGLEMNVKEIRNVGLPFLLIGISQIALTLLAGFWLATLLGFSNLISFYIASAFTISSSVIIVRILSEGKNLKSLYGRIAVGLLLFQHLFAMFVIIFLSGLGKESSTALNLVSTLVTGGVFVSAAVGLSIVLPRFLEFLGGASELLYLFSISWAVGLGALFASPWLGLSVEVGGFLAGITLANSSEHFQISARMKPLRDFFLIILFIGLGINMFLNLGAIAPIPAIALSTFAIIGSPIIVFLIMSLLKYRARTSFLVGLTTIPLSEFSFIIMFLGEKLNHVESSHVSLVALVAIISILASSYLIAYGNQIYALLKPALKLFESKRGVVEEKGEETYLENHIVLAGVHRMGFNILRALSSSGDDFVAVDLDLQVISSLREGHLPALYGDITDAEIQELVALDKARLLISTIPDFKTNATLIEYLKKHNLECKAILTAESEHEAEDLYDLGADYVLLPHFIGGVEVAEIIAKDRDLANLDSLRERDFKLIRGEEVLR